MKLTFTTSRSLSATSDERSWQAKSIPGLLHVRRGQDGTLYLCWGRACLAEVDPTNPWLWVDLKDEDGIAMTAPVPPPEPAAQPEAPPQPQRRRTRQNGS